MEEVKVKERTRHYLEAYLLTNADVLEEPEVVELKELIEHHSDGGK